MINFKDIQEHFDNRLPESYWNDPSDAEYEAQLDDEVAKDKEYIQEKMPQDEYIELVSEHLGAIIAGWSKDDLKAIVNDYISGQLNSTGVLIDFISDSRSSYC